MSHDLEVHGARLRSMASMPKRVGLDGLRALMEWDRDPALESCPVPVDVIATAEFLDRDAAARLPSTVTVHAAALGGHLFLRDRPEETARRLRQLLDQHA